jgi:hypothetical protein
MRTLRAGWLDASRHPTAWVPAQRPATALKKNYQEAKTERRTAANIRKWRQRLGTCLLRIAATTGGSLIKLLIWQYRGPTVMPLLDARHGDGFSLCPARSFCGLSTCSLGGSAACLEARAVETFLCSRCYTASFSILRFLRSVCACSS